MLPDLNQVAQRILAGEPALTPGLAATVANWPIDRLDELIERLLPDAAGRRWLRGSLLPELTDERRIALARRLRTFETDFASSRRDSTTRQVVAALPLDDLIGSSGFFAGSNAAGPFWERLADERPDDIARIVIAVLRSGDAIARETTLYILLLDPHSEIRLNGADRTDVLNHALFDPNDEVRGIAADVLADEAPELLLARAASLTLDSSEAVRMAAWEAAFTFEFELARDDALDLALDESMPVEPRRSAVAALSAVLTTTEIAPLLQALVAHPNRMLAEDAVNILWTYHRAPAIAMAAAESPHDSVREVAQRLLHPETGSPAAGGSRPGAPDAPRDIYQEMLKGYERRGDDEKNGR